MRFNSESLRSWTCNILPCWKAVLFEEETGYVLNSKIKQEQPGVVEDVLVHGRDVGWDGL